MRPAVSRPPPKRSFDIDPWSVNGPASWPIYENRVFRPAPQTVASTRTVRNVRRSAAPETGSEGRGTLTWSLWEQRFGTGENRALELLRRGCRPKVGQHDLVSSGLRSSPHQSGGGLACEQSSRGKIERAPRRNHTLGRGGRQAWRAFASPRPRWDGGSETSGAAARRAFKALGGPFEASRTCTRASHTRLLAKVVEQLRGASRGTGSRDNAPSRDTLVAGVTVPWSRSIRASSEGVEEHLRVGRTGHRKVAPRKRPPACRFGQRVAPSNPCSAKDFHDSDESNRASFFASRSNAALGGSPRPDDPAPRRGGPAKARAFRRSSLERPFCRLTPIFLFGRPRVYPRSPLLRWSSSASFFLLL